MSSQCCGYGTDAADAADGFDCALIPGASKLATAAGLVQTLVAGAANGFCGGELGTSSGSIAAATICSKYFPSIRNKYLFYHVKYRRLFLTLIPYITKHTL